MDLSALKSFLHTQFHTKKFGALEYLLGMEVMQNKNVFFPLKKHMCLTYWQILGSQEKNHAVPLCSLIHKWQKMVNYLMILYGIED